MEGYARERQKYVKETQLERSGDPSGGFFFHRANYNSNSLYTTFTASGPFPTSKKTLQSALVRTRERAVYSWPRAKTGTGS